MVPQKISSRRSYPRAPDRRSPVPPRRGRCDQCTPAHTSGWPSCPRIADRRVHHRDLAKWPRHPRRRRRRAVLASCAPRCAYRAGSSFDGEWRRAPQRTRGTQHLDDDKGSGVQQVYVLGVRDSEDSRWTHACHTDPTQQQALPVSTGRGGSSAVDGGPCLRQGSAIQQRSAGEESMKRGTRGRVGGLALAALLWLRQRHRRADPIVHRPLPHR